MTAWVRSAAGALAVGVLAGALIDPLATPWSGNERISAVLLVDGQAYFGHLTDLPWSETIELRDVYYFQDARVTSAGLPLGLQRRGGELHQPTQRMTFRRDKVLAVEPLAAISPVRTAIAVDRALSGAR